MPAVKFWIYLWLVLLCSLASALQIPVESLNAGMVVAIKSQYPSVAEYPVTAQVLLKLNQEQALTVSTDTYRLRYTLNEGLGPRMHALITVYAEDNPIRTIRLPFTVGVYVPVLHARGEYASGEPVTNNMFYAKEINVIDRLSSVIYPREDLTGRKLLSNIHADQIMARWMLMRIPRVIVGEIIPVVARTDDVELRLSAEVLQAGFVGDRIRVRLRPTKKIVVVRIVAQGVYEVQE